MSGTGQHSRRPTGRSAAARRTRHRSRRRTIPVIVLVLCLCIALAIAFFALSRNRSSETAQTGYVSPYDWSGLTVENGRYRYTENGVVCSKTGIDVSEHDGAIDWSAVSSDGIEFAMIRLGNRGTTEGGLFLDDMYSANVQGATSAGIPLGIYFFSQALNEDEAREEADFVLENLADAKLTYPIVFDEEVTGTDSRAAKLSKAQLTANAKAFCERIRAAGYDVALYGNKYDIARFDLSSLSDIPVWYAQYGADHPDGQFDFIMWQYTEDGSVAGIDGSVDMDLYFTTTS